LRAAFITETGPTDAIHIGELPLATIGLSDVLVKVQATASTSYEVLS